MPAGDRTGPMGMGSMTGRGAGFCSGSNAPGYAGYGPGRGFGFGPGFGRGGGFGRRFFGRGFGWRNRFYATGLPAWGRTNAYAAPNPETEKQGLKQQAEALQSELEMVRKRLDEMESGAD